MDIYYLCGGFCGAVLGNVVKFEGVRGCVRDVVVDIYYLCGGFCTGRGCGGDEECCGV